MPTYDPDSWIPHQFNNNCYDYACDNKTKRPPWSKSEPGRGSGRPVGRPLTCENVTAACVRDGLKTTVAGREVDRDTVCGFGCWKIALLISTESDDTDNDYHFVRQDDNGWWSHKMDHRVAQDFDASGVTSNFQKSIRDPETANWDYRPKFRLNYKFCRYLCVCPDDLRIAQLPMTSPDETYALHKPLHVTLREPATLSVAGMSIQLPPGVLELGYLDADRREPPPSTIVRSLIFSGREDPSWPLSAANTRELEIRLSELWRHHDDVTLREPRFGIDGVSSGPWTRSFVVVGGGLVGRFSNAGATAIFEDTAGIEAWLTRVEQDGQRAVMNRHWDELERSDR